jgi:hypothetical protein
MDGAHKAAVIRAIQQLAEENGGVPVGKERFVAETGFSDYLFQGRLWATWSDAVREAGYDPNPFGSARLDEDALLRQLADLTRKLGKLPTKAQIRLEGRGNAGFPSATTFGTRFGTKAQQAAALHAFIERSPEFADIAAMLPTVADEPVREPDEADNPNAAQPMPGFVYLVRSGKFHKIGRSNIMGGAATRSGYSSPRSCKWCTPSRPTTPWELSITGPSGSKTAAGMANGSCSPRPTSQRSSAVAHLCRAKAAHHSAAYPAAHPRRRGGMRLSRARPRVEHSFIQQAGANGPHWAMGRSRIRMRRAQTWSTGIG